MYYGKYCIRKLTCILIRNIVSSVKMNEAMTHLNMKQTFC